MTKKQVMLDTNAVLRFITGDNKEKCNAVSELLNDADCIVSIEVLAETVFNLEKSYNHPRQLIAEEIKDFISIKQNLVLEENVVHYGCNIYALTKLDFIDCLLVAYANVKGKVIFTFDSELKKHLGHNAYSKNISV